MERLHIISFPEVGFMLAKKAAVCAVIFALLLAGAWLAERQLSDDPRTEASDGLNDEASGPRAARVYNAHPEFRSREYVKILRIGDGTEPIGP